MDHKLIRTFVAVPVPEPVLALQKTLRSTIDPKRGQIKWVRPDQLHLTLKFIGYTPESSFDDIRSVLDGIANNTRPIQLNIEGTGCFPKKERPRVLWAGIQGEIEKLNTLVNATQSALDLLGFFKDDKPYHPHITMGRARYPQKHTPDVSFFLDAPYSGIPFGIEKIQFISSELFPNGPVYTILSTHFFKNNSV
ncbi:MAG: RNA 2',3'-cyclic phosphodiesterase [Candidatus Marinimicrobia bacterium]|jgi:2'-5' RNA ligase|nr:RNA 2',3'-cyclic phosphodiesterase [Candidatus Neomarinimicrobiota bacterium]